MDLPQGEVSFRRGTGDTEIHEVDGERDDSKLCEDVGADNDRTQEWGPGHMEVKLQQKKI